MGVRKTESRIPEGFNYTQLGKTCKPQKNDNGTFQLVSFFGDNLYLIQKNPKESLSYIDNTFVVFITKLAEGINAKDIKYHWTITLKGNEIEDKSLTPTTEYGVLNLICETELVNNLEAYSKLKVSVKIKETDKDLAVMSLAEFSMTRKLGIAESIQNIDSRITDSGNSEVTDQISTQYLDLLKDKFEANNIEGWDELKKFQIPLNLVTTTLYLKLLGNLLPNTSALTIEDILNSKGDREKKILKEYKIDPLKFHVGKLELKPHILGQVLFPSSFDKSFSSEEELVGTFASYCREGEDDSFVIDLYNLCRFPKTSIALSSLMLSKIKKENPNEVLRQLPLIDFPKRKDLVIKLIAGLYNGVYIESYSGSALELANKVFSNAWSPKIIEILDSAYIPFEAIFVKVLDIRSGRPIEGAKIKKLVIHSYSGNEETALSEEIIIKDRYLYFKGKISQRAELNKAAKRALYRLGYERNFINEYEKQTKKIINSIKEGENKFIKGPKIWKQKHKKAFDKFWKDRNIDTQGLYKEKGNSRKPKKEALKYIIQSYNQHGFVNEHGVLTIMIPKGFLAGKKVNIEIGFWEFATILEKTKRDNHGIIQYNGSENPTGFNLNWIGFQNNDWEDNLNGQHFGWQVADSAGEKVNLQAAQKIIIKDDFESFVQVNHSLISERYNSHHCHFVLYGMQWCQPVWDNISDSVLATNSKNPINERVYIQNLNKLNLKMHLVTHWARMGGYKASGNEENPAKVTARIADKYGGKGYGKIEFTSKTRWRSQDKSFFHAFYSIPDLSSDFPVFAQVPTHPETLKEDIKEFKDYLHTLGVPPDSIQIIEEPEPTGHSGIDIHVKIGDPIFSILGGRVSQLNIKKRGKKKGHKYVKVYNTQYRRWSIGYLHLWKFNKLDNRVVLAGTIIGYGGRSGNLGWRSSNPTHLHLNLKKGNNPYESKFKRILLDSEDPNMICIPDNDIPLIFPCQCQTTNDLPPKYDENYIKLKGNEDEVINQSSLKCAFDSVKYISQCWAAAELKCPYMAKLEKPNIFSLQCQLRYLSEKKELEDGTIELKWRGPEKDNDTTNYFPYPDTNDKGNINPNKRQKRFVEELPNPSDSKHALSKAIYKFRMMNSCLFDPESNPKGNNKNHTVDFNGDEDFWLKLNELAPIEPFN